MINADELFRNFPDENTQSLRVDYSTPVRALTSPLALDDVNGDFSISNFFDSLGLANPWSFDASEPERLSSTPVEADNGNSGADNPVSREDEGNVIRNVSSSSSSDISVTQKINGETECILGISRSREGKREVRNEASSLSSSSSSSKRARSAGNLQTAVTKSRKYATAGSKKTRLTPDEYENFFTDLKRLGYEDKDIRKLLSRRLWNITCENLIKNLTAIMELEHFKRDGLTCSHLVKVCSPDGGNRNLESLISYYETLRDLGYSLELIIGLVACKGGTGNLKAVCNNHEKLIQFGFNVTQIARIASKDGGSLNLNSVTRNYNFLKEKGLSFDKITDIASFHAGSVNIETLVSTFDDLRRYGYTGTQIIALASHYTCSSRLENLKANHEDLHSFGFSNQEIISMISQPTKRDCDKLDFVTEFCRTIPRHQIVTKKIVTSVKKGWENFLAYKTVQEQLTGAQSRATQTTVHGSLPAALVCPPSPPLPPFTGTGLSNSLFNGSDSFFYSGRLVSEPPEFAEPDRCQDFDLFS